MNYETMLTTIDNPFDPFEDFINWFLFDTEKGYNTCSYLARIARISDEFTDEENDLEIESACDEILKYDLTNNYRIVRKQKNNPQEK